MNGLKRDSNNRFDLLKGAVVSTVNAAWEQEGSLIAVDNSKNWDDYNTWALCPKHSYLVQIFCNGGGESNQVEYIYCRKLKAKQWKDCVDVSSEQFADKDGTGTCAANGFITGMYRSGNADNNLSGITQIRCCKIANIA